MLKVPETEPKHQSGATSCVAAVTNQDSETLSENLPFPASPGNWLLGIIGLAWKGPGRKVLFGQNFLPFFCTKCHFQNNCFLAE